MSLRTVTLRVPPQDVITRDNGPAGGYVRVHDVRLGEIGGAPVYVDADQDQRWATPALLRRRAPGPPTAPRPKDSRASIPSPGRRDGGWRVQNPARAHST
jgi:hypothetical protein